MDTVEFKVEGLYSGVVAEELGGYSLVNIDFGRGIAEDFVGLGSDIYDCSVVVISSVNYLDSPTEIR